MTVKHTPGPWRALPGSFAFSFTIVGANEDPIAETRDVAGAKANAKLIAAAPDAVPLIEWMAQGYGIPVPLLEKARAWLRAAGRPHER